jgi:urease accessory protein
LRGPTIIKGFRVRAPYPRISRRDHRRSAWKENDMPRIIVRSLAGAATILPSAALAHTGHGETAGLLHGFMHPVGGLDHVLAMVAVGILAYQLGGRALWLLPAAFVTVMSIGWAFGVAGWRPPSVEIGIAASVIVAGAAIALNLRTSAAIAAAVVGVFALFHGFAHGMEMPQAGSAAAYAAGFAAATAMLHLVGIGFGRTATRLSRGHGGGLLRVAGGAMALAGGVILTQAV